MTKHCPTFVLRGVELNKLLDDYNSGKFSVEVPIRSKIKLVENTTLIAPKYGNSNADPIYSIKDKNNYDIVIATSGHENHKFYHETKSLPVGGRCDTCKVDFSHSPVGCPVKMEHSYILVPSETGDPDDAVYRQVYYFMTEGCFCSFRCTLYYIMQEQTKTYSHRDCNLKFAEENLRYLFTLTHPDAPELLPCNNPRLLQSNGGSLTREQWENKSYFYEDTYRVYTLPVKRDFVQQQHFN